MKIRYLFLLLLLSPFTHAECVILLHGLARTDNSMDKLQAALVKEDFTVINVRYESTKNTIETLAPSAIDPALEKCGVGIGVNFVTHSMGGILVRQYLSQKPLPQLNKVVMLGPPNKGSEVVDVLGQFPGFHFVNGDAGLQLGTGQSSVPNTLGAVDFDLGIIAGSRSINLILSAIIPGPDDGKVTIENTKIQGMTDHIEMPVTHPFMMRNEDVINQVIYYLRHGSFSREAIQ
jgi:pimeloyl-ACP methyl ester carboxylesterase